MPNRRVRGRLQDIINAIDEARKILDGADYAIYERSLTKRRGVERCIEIVSEASRLIPHELCDQHPEIPWPEVRGIGNQLRHGYQTVSNLIIWRTATFSLPELRRAVEQMLSENNGTPWLDRVQGSRMRRVGDRTVAASAFQGDISRGSSP